MAKKRLKIFLITLFIVVLIIVIIPLGGYLILKFGFDIDVIAINKQIKILSKEVDESSLIALYGEEDEDSLLLKLKNAGFGDRLNNNVGNVFLIAEDNKENITLTSDLILNEKELACLLDSYINYILTTATESDEQKNDIAEFNTSVLGIQIDNVRKGNSVVFEQTVADITAVIKINIKKLKEETNVFPISIFSKKLPDELYIKSTFSLKTTANGTGYEIENHSFVLNSMTVDETKKFVQTMQFILGSYDEMSEDMATMIGETIISDGKGAGLIDILKVFGVKTYNFINTESEQNLIYQIA